jgi:ABC-type nitrate/sulfonate/bicarbonate transport system substrate-binding protein
MRVIASPLLTATILLTACGSAAATASPPASGASPKTAAAPAQAGGAPTKLVVGFSQYIPQYLPLWVAQDAGIYARNGLDVDQHMLSSTTGLTALIASEVQVNVGGGPELVSAGAGGADVAALANLTPVSAFKFEAQKSIQTKQDLIGKKIGISRFGSNTDTATRALLTREGLDPEKDVTYIQMDTSSNTTAGLIAGSIQAALSTPPNTLTVEANGLHPLYDLAALKVPAVDAIVEVRRSWLGSNRATAQRFIDSLVQSMALMRQDKAVTETSLKKNMKLEDQTAIDAVYSFFVGSVFPALPYLQPEQFSDVMPILVKQSEKLAGYDVNKIIDSSLVKDAADRSL